MRRQFALLACAFAPAACSPSAKAVPIRGPDGSPMLHVSCGSDEARCYQLAGEHCPMGYDLAPSPGSSGNFLVRCRSLQAFVPAVVQAPPQLGVPPAGYPPASYPPAAAAPGYPPLGPGHTDPNDVGY